MRHSRRPSFEAPSGRGEHYARRYYHIIQTLTQTCREAGLADPVVCGYDWRQSVKFVAESWVGPLIWQHVGNRKKVRLRCQAGASHCRWAAFSTHPA